jgi:hypothetical protein
MMGDLPRARALPARLEAACPGSCEEQHDDLVQAIERYQAVGGRHVPG